MTKYFSKITAILVVIMGVSFASSAQIVIKVRPVAPVIVKTVSPSPRHVWVSGEYVYSGNQYVYKEGYWVVPPPRRARWVEGHWRHRRGGWVWVPGHWR